MSSGSRMFQLKVDPLTGNSEWVVIEEHKASLDATKQLLTNTSYLDMLNDTRRNKAYREAIDKTITKPCHVLDIGAGTGLLSMMAARAMGHGDSMESSGSKGMVTACESYLPIVKLMRKILHTNDMQRKIRIISKRSDELEVDVDMPSRADVLLVESTDLWKLHDLFNNEKGVLDELRLVPEEMDAALCVKHQQFSMHCDALKEDIKLLSEPFKVFDFDFWKRPDSRREPNGV